MPHLLSKIDRVGYGLLNQEVDVDERQDAQQLVTHIGDERDDIGRDFLMLDDDVNQSASKRGVEPLSRRLLAIPFVGKVCNILFL